MESLFDEQRQQGCQKAGVDVVDEMADGDGDDTLQAETAEGLRCRGCAWLIVHLTFCTGGLSASQDLNHTTS
jgi:hypothetical protein